MRSMGSEVQNIGWGFVVGRGRGVGDDEPVELDEGDSIEASVFHYAGIAFRSCLWSSALCNYREIAS